MDPRGACRQSPTEAKSDAAGGVEIAAAGQRYFGLAEPSAPAEREHFTERQEQRARPVQFPGPQVGAFGGPQQLTAQGGADGVLAFRQQGL